MQHAEHPKRQFVWERCSNWSHNSNCSRDRCRQSAALGRPNATGPHWFGKTGARSPRTGHATMEQKNHPRWLILNSSLYFASSLQVFWPERMLSVEETLVFEEGLCGVHKPPISKWSHFLNGGRESFEGLDSQVYCSCIQKV